MDSELDIDLEFPDVFLSYINGGHPPWNERCRASDPGSPFVTLRRKTPDVPIESRSQAVQT